jgi:hypothetical protein
LAARHEGRIIARPAMAHLLMLMLMPPALMLVIGRGFTSLRQITALSDEATTVPFSAALVFKV